MIDESTQAQQAAAVEGITAGGLIEGFGAGFNPRTGLWTFPDGSTGKFSNHGKQRNDGGKYFYPFVVADAPLTFPDAETDASVDTPVQRNRRGEPIPPMTAGEPRYTGEHADNFGHGVAQGKPRQTQPERKVTRLTKED